MQKDHLALHPASTGAAEAGAPGAPAVTRRGAIAAAVIGNWLEFFDFTVYGFFAVLIGKLFFPSSDPTTSLLLSVATFAAGFFTRPLGSVVLGVYADRKGRKAALNLTIMLMALGTGLIAIAPTYAQVGVAAPLLVVFARLLQGFSQGGEFGAATSTLLEQGGTSRRGFRASWQLATQGGAALMGSGFAALLSNTMTKDALEGWGWRLPFLVGVLIAPVGMFLRRRLADDAPGDHHHGIERGVLHELFSKHTRTVLLLMLTVMGGTVSTYILTFYMPTYAIHTLGLPMKLSMFVGVASGCVMLVTCPLFGWLSDRLGSRRLPIFVGRGVLVALLFPAFWLMNHHPTLSVILPLTALMLLFYSLGSASEMALMCESLPRHVRATGISIAYALAVTIFGGTAQLIATWLVKTTGSKLAPAGYVAACVVLSLVAVAMLRETARESLD
ncbi:MFS transporter [Burkholderia cenocepacia]|uniref:MFS transporter n=1 Tax=Burkholderia cenocepacia TaxID=95486 RepID=UPI00073A56AE|nr:MFS transporter [Burkholderia cenocepacia]ALV58179.1 MFS transporter [Burkholderia cenocepacia]AQQ21821.1 MFS transporter [Burkholderia cenocepacia]AQQ47558.1 MFS transporter [Burkholderia cenocepacia]KWF26301.1 MFS transporter [Burkholderia cenocepacia]MBR7944193.1 MFS transporter [Burkholderia cenocepacia]